MGRAKRLKKCKCNLCPYSAQLGDIIKMPHIGQPRKYVKIFKLIHFNKSRKSKERRKEKEREGISKIHSKCSQHGFFRIGPLATEIFAQKLDQKKRRLS